MTNPKFMKSLQPDAELAEIVGTNPLPRTEVIKKIWNYIKKNGLQDRKNKRNINPDENLAKVFNGKTQINMFEIAGFISKHLR